MASYTNIVLFLVRSARARNWLPQKSFHFSSKVFFQYITLTYQRNSSDIGNFRLHLWEKFDTQFFRHRCRALFIREQIFTYFFLFLENPFKVTSDAGIEFTTWPVCSSKIALQKMGDFGSSSNTHWLTTKKISHNL